MSAGLSPVSSVVAGASGAYCSAVVGGVDPTSGLASRVIVTVCSSGVLGRGWAKRRSAGSLRRGKSWSQRLSVVQLEEGGRGRVAVRDGPDRQFRYLCPRAICSNRHV